MITKNLKEINRLVEEDSEYFKTEEFLEKYSKAMPDCVMVRSDFDESYCRRYLYNGGDIILMDIFSCGETGNS